MRDAGFIDNVLGESLGGTYDNADVVDEDINDLEYMGGRASVRWLPNESWTVDAGVVYQQMDANSYTEDNVERSGRENAVVRFVDESREDEWTQLALTLQGDLGFGQFTSASSYFTRRIAYFQDNTDYTFYLSSGPGASYVQYNLGPDPVGLGWSDGPYADRIAQEFRLQGATEKMTWLAGLFYEKVEEGYSFFTRTQDYEDSPSFNYWNTYYGVEPGTTDDVFYHSKNDQKTEQFAAFGEVGYSPNEDWTFTAGLRWFDHTRTRDYFIQTPNGHFTANLGTAEESTSDITKKLSVQYNFTGDVMAYALYSDGYRAGGRNVVRPGTVLPPDYDPDFLYNYELGLKSRLMGGRLGMNLTLLPHGMGRLPGRGRGSGPVVRHAGRKRRRCRDRRREPRLHARYLWDSVDFGLNLQLLNAETKSDNDIIGTVAGTRLPFSAEEKGAVWLEYTFPGEFVGGQFYGRVQWSYNGNSLNGIGDDAVLQPAYQITDAKIGLAADEWEVYAYVDNLTDERAILFDQGSAPPGTVVDQLPAHLGHRLLEELGRRQLTAPQKARPRIGSRPRAADAQARAIRPRHDRRDPRRRRPVPRRLRARRRPGRDPDALLARRRFRLPARVGREPDARHVDRRADLRDGDAPRRAGPRPLGFPSLRQLPLRRPLRQAGGSRPIRASAKRRMRVFMEGLFPGRWETLRPVKAKELKATRLLSLRIDEASAKIRSGPPADDAADVTWPTWGGVLPLSMHAGAPQPDDYVKDKALHAPRSRAFKR